MNTKLKEKVALYNSQLVYNSGKRVNSLRIALNLLEKFNIPKQYKVLCTSVIICDLDCFEVPNNNLNPNTRSAIKFADRFFRARFLNGVRNEDKKIVSIRVFKVTQKVFDGLSSFYKSLAVKEGNLYTFYIACVAPKEKETICEN